MLSRALRVAATSAGRGRPLRVVGLRALSAGPPAPAPIPLALSTDTADAAATVEALEPLGTGFTDLPVHAIAGLTDLLGLPVWGSVLVATVVMRSALAPLTIKSARTSAKMAGINPKLQELKTRMIDAQANNPEGVSKIQAEMQRLMQETGVSPLSALLPMLQFPVFICFFLGLRKVPDYVDVTQGGFGWIADLSVPDPYYALPAANAVLFLAMTEFGQEPGREMPPTMKNVMRGLAVLSAPLTAQLDAIVQVYFSASSIFSVGWATLMRQKVVRQILDIPDAPKPVPGATPDNPLAALFSQGPEKKPTAAAAEPDDSKPTYRHHRRRWRR